MRLSRIRAGIPALASCIYLNTGTFGPLPRVAADELRRAYREIERQGTFAPPIFREMELAGLEAVRAQWAAFMHVAPEELALNQHVTDGINTVRHGLDWQAGDEVILSDQEHESGTVPWLALAERQGVRLRFLTLVHDHDEIVRRFEALLTPRTRLACLSHVSCLTGLRLPVARLCALARQAGVLTLVDGAHAEGQFAVDVAALGCDFYAACGHKWLLGPQGVGALYVRRELLDQLRPAWLGWGVNKRLLRDDWRYELEPTAARYEQSTQPWPLFLAFGKSLHFVQEVGTEAIEARVGRLRTMFLEQLATIPGVRLHSPAQPELATGLVTASVPGWECEALSQQLWDRHRILTNIIRDRNALRFSLAFFTSEAELQASVEAIRAASTSQ